MDEGEEKHQKEEQVKKKEKSYEPLADVKFLDINLVNVSRINEIMFNDIVDAYKRLLEKN